MLVRIRIKQYNYNIPCIQLGLGISKTWLDICRYNAEHKPLYRRFGNDNQGHKALIGYLMQELVKLIVCEPTGGYERSICEQLYANNLPVHQVNTYSFSAFSQSVHRCKKKLFDRSKSSIYISLIQQKVR